MDYIHMFHSLHPGFFQRESIRAIPEEFAFTELVMDLRGGFPDMPPCPCPDGISFGMYQGKMETLHQAVAQVNADWVKYFREGGRILCAMDGENVASFCNISDMGRHLGLRIGGPGCVGTVPQYRKKGIGLELVRRATLMLQQDGFDLSWIHFTYVERWYMKLGYQPVCRWNSGGILPDGAENTDVRA